MFEQQFGRDAVNINTQYPGCEAVNELQIRCGKCRMIQMVNRLRYAKHFGDSKYRKLFGVDSQVT